MRPFRHCPWCGVPLGPIVGTLQTCEACGEPTWHNAKPCAGGFVTRADGALLLGRRAHEPFAGRWDIPGGFLHPDETPEQGCRRELREETGLEVEVGRYLGGWVDTYGDAGEETLNLYFVCRVVAGEPRAADDVSELRWFPRDALPPPHELAFEHAPAALTAWLRTAAAPA